MSGRLNRARNLLGLIGRSIFFSFLLFVFCYCQVAVRDERKKKKDI